MKKKKVALGKLSLNKGTIAPLTSTNVAMVVGGATIDNCSLNSVCICAQTKPPVCAPITVGETLPCNGRICFITD
ncbi:class I lanthipeptide [Taibaiella koreensis]|uniref:class I lanthipeptide n=1 Tax=Taibaiella koreensis TaxID=1268548 RepID=UPI0013C36EDA|nr:class I lanthipeptide [Taibaiella koreensis]